MMRISRRNYDKAGRCPTWSGGGMTVQHNEEIYKLCNNSGMYEGLNKFTKCPECGVIMIPLWTQWFDPTWLAVVIKFKKNAVKWWLEDFVRNFRTR